jgi:divalent metal cation (Fe/Co/Zn/Cd) transporter
MSPEVRSVFFGVALGFASAAIFGFAIGSNLAASIISVIISLVLFFVAKERKRS